MNGSVFEARPRQEFRAWLEEDGLRICRDIDGQPQHADYFWPYPSDAEIDWKDHAEGDWVPPVTVMSPEFW